MTEFSSIFIVCFDFKLLKVVSKLLGHFRSKLCNIKYRFRKSEPISALRTLFDISYTNVGRKP